MIRCDVIQAEPADLDGFATYQLRTGAFVVGTLRCHPHTASSLRTLLAPEGQSARRRAVGDRQREREAALVTGLRALQDDARVRGYGNSVGGAHLLAGIDRLLYERQRRAQSDEAAERSESPS